MLSPQEVTDLVGQIVANAGKLGLTWQIRPATVVGSDDDGSSLVVIDGADLAAAAPTPATPLDGLPLAGARVFVVTVPPNGDYIIGSVPSEGHARMSGETGVANLAFASAASFTQAVTFDRSFTTAPTVVTSIASGSGEVSRWISRAFSVSTTGFTLWVARGDGVANAWTGNDVAWAALVNE